MAEARRATLPGVQPLSAEDIGQPFRASVSVQDYSPTTAIAGVELLQLRRMVDDGGEFMELLRLDEQGCLQAKPSMRVVQVNYSRVLPGAIKAFHLHYQQEDVWFVPPSDRLLLGLVDVREQSPTYGQRMRFVLGEGQPRMVHIPRGVAHGAANIWARPAQIIYLVNQHFSLQDPDERRLPWDLCGADFWAIAPG